MKLIRHDHGAEESAGPRLGSVHAVAASGECLKIEAPLPVLEAGSRLREALAGVAVEGRSPVLLVTGPVPPRDLARAALALASSWLREEHPVALVDLALGRGVYVDPRSGEQEEGLGDHLLFGASLTRIERETGIPGLVLIPAGAGSPETSRVLAEEPARAFVAALRERYRASFLCGDLSYDAEPLHPLFGWVDGWVGVVPSGAPPAAALGRALGWVEVRAPLREEPGEAAGVEAGVEAVEPVAREAEVEGMAEPEALEPALPAERRERGALLGRFRGRAGWRVPVLAAAAVVLLAVGVWRLLPALRSQPPPTREESIPFPKPSPTRPVAEAPPAETKLQETPVAAPSSETSVAGAGETHGQTPPVEAKVTPTGGAESAPAAAPAPGTETLRPPPAETREEPRAVPAEAPFAVHVSSYQSTARADTEISQLRAQGLDAERVRVDLGERGIWYRVYVGRCATREEALGLAARLKAELGFEYAQVVKR